MKRYILISANPAERKLHKGGVLTLSIGLLEYAQKKDIHVKVINTLRKDINDLNFINTLYKGLSRCLILIKEIIFSEKYNGIIIVSSAGFSLYERSFQALIARVFHLKSILIIVDGNLLRESRCKKVEKIFHNLIFRIPTYIASPGAKFNKYFNEIKLNPKKHFILNFWLPNNFPIKNCPKEYKTDESIKFLFVGWLIKEKGIIELLNAILLLKNEKRFEIEIIGGGPLEQFIANFIHKNKLIGTVKFSGKVDDSTLRKAFEQSHILVLPSMYEGFPMTIIEGFHYGLPVISSNVGGISSVVKDSINGFIIDSVEPTSIYKAMKLYLDNPEIIENHSRDALFTAKVQFNQEENCDFLFSKLA